MTTLGAEPVTDRSAANIVATAAGLSAFVGATASLNADMRWGGQCYGTT
ncbi:hypothetical protein LV564_00820 (plasmid) [Komagataeibacter nataicola]|nr:hypothetical protein [Komagataeibacter nataicola]WEQ54265.1 hypothetical protein LV564_00820 [Komagataeibacter nataicola]